MSSLRRVNVKLTERQPHEKLTSPLRQPENMLFDNVSNGLWMKVSNKHNGGY